MKNSYLSKICLLKSSLAEIYAQVSKTGKLTLSDRYGLMAALLQSSLSEEEQNSINRLLRGVRRGRLKVVDEM